MSFLLFSANFHSALFSSGFQRVALLGEDCCGSRCWIKLYRCCIPLFLPTCSSGRRSAFGGQEREGTNFGKECLSGGRSVLSGLVSFPVG